MGWGWVHPEVHRIRMPALPSPAGCPWESYFFFLGVSFLILGLSRLLLGGWTRGIQGHLLGRFLHGLGPNPGAAPRPKSSLQVFRTRHRGGAATSGQRARGDRCRGNSRCRFPKGSLPGVGRRSPVLPAGRLGPAAGSARPAARPTPVPLGSPRPDSLRRPADSRPGPARPLTPSAGR